MSKNLIVNGRYITTESELEKFDKANVKAMYEYIIRLFWGLDAPIPELTHQQMVGYLEKTKQIFSKSEEE